MKKEPPRKPSAPKSTNPNPQNEQQQQQQQHHRTSISRNVTNLREMDHATMAHMLATPHGGVVASSLNVRGYRSRYFSRDQLSATDMEKLIFRRMERNKPGGVMSLEDAIAAAGTGKFQVWLMFTCGMIYFTGSMSTTALSFILPACDCDLSISSMQKGIISSAPLVGMVLGTFIWGPMSDNKGRKYSLVICLIIDLIANTVSAFSFNKWFLLACRFFNGFGSIGSTSMVFAYFGEFLLPSARDKLLFAIEMFWTFGIMYVPGLMTISSWNLFILCLGIPNLIALACLARIPESPHFLLEKGDFDGTYRALKFMYRTNRGKKAPPYPVVILSDTPEAKIFFTMGAPLPCWESIRFYFECVATAHKDVCHKSIRCNLFKCCAINSALNFSYLTMMIWVPELINRWDIYMHGKDENATATLCDAATAISQDEADFCTEVLEEGVYLRVIIISLCCAFTTTCAYFALLFIGKKILLFFALTAACGGAVGLVVANTTILETAMACVLESFCTLVETLVFCCVVDLFPVHVRGTALALTVTSGRIAAIVGTVYMGFLLNNYCLVPMISFSVSLMVGAIVVITLPRMGESAW